MGTRALRAWVLATAVILLAVMKLPASGQGTTTNSDVLAALLTEVRGLRAAMELMASAGLRVQLVMGRLQLQEQRVTTMLRRLDDVRDRVLREEHDVARMQQDLTRMQNATQHVIDPKERQAIEEQSGELKGHLARAQMQLQRLRTEQADIAGSVAAEQSRWVDINQRLEELERALTRR